MIEMRVLKYFLVVAQEESITRAAKVLLTSQPNLSKQMADLERQVGHKLFERGSRKIALTEEGVFLRRRAQEIVELGERTEDELATFGERIAGTVHIGAAESRSMKLLADAMVSLRLTHPLIDFDVFSGSTAEVSDRLRTGIVDFAVLVAPFDQSEYDYLRFPKSDSFGLLMRKDSPLAELDAVSPGDVEGRPVLVARQQLEGNVLSGWLGDDMTTALDIAATFNLVTTPAMMVEAGLGEAFCFGGLVDVSEESPLTFRPLTPALDTQLYLVWKKYQQLPRPAQEFLEAARGILVS